jgi:hypothetical protein
MFEATFEPNIGFFLIRRSVNKWPNYGRCVSGAPLNHEGTAPDHSRADFAFCVIAIDWGWSIEETAAKLMDESAKARENGQKYAQLTAERATEAAALRQGFFAHRTRKV